jgi:hypothetical protein
VAAFIGDQADVCQVGDSIGVDGDQHATDVPLSSVDDKPQVFFDASAGSVSLDNVGGLAESAKRRAVERAFVCVWQQFGEFVVVGSV